MTAGSLPLILILLALVVAATGYSVGRLHQWWRAGEDRDEAYREGYDSATRSAFSLAARMIGSRRPPAGYLKRLREITQQHNALLIADEIQSGLGRTGKLFAYEHEGIRPDIVIVGKALSGGFYPVSGILADEAVMNVFKPGEHGSTYGGNPMAAAVAQAALRVLVDEKMIERSAELGPYFLERLRGIRSQHVKEVRGVGL